MAAKGMRGFVSPLAEIMSKKAELPVYSPHDTHWTGYGSYEGYQVLLQMLGQLGMQASQPYPLSRFPQEPTPPSSQPRNLSGMLGISSFVMQNYPQFSSMADKAVLKTTYLTAKTDWTSPHLIETGHSGPVLQLVIDSFSNDLLPYLYPHFSKIILSHNQDGFYRPDLMRTYKQDFVGIEVIESGVRHAMGGGQFGSAPPVTVAVPSSPTQVQSIPQVPATPSSAPATQSASQAGFAVFDAESGTYRKTHQCNLEVLEPAGDRVHVAGWFADVERKQALRSPVYMVALSPAAHYRVAMPLDHSRPDVAAHFSDSALSASGFDSMLDMSQLKPGKYDVVLRADSGLECVTTRELARK